MKFQKSTLILMLSALFFGGIVYVFETEGRPQLEAAKTKENLIFDFQEKDVRTVILTTKERTLQFERNSQQKNNSVASKWLLKILENPKKIESPKDAAATKSPEPKPTESPKDAAATKSPDPKPTESPKEVKATKSPDPKPTEQAKATVPTQMPANEAYVAYLLDKIVKAKGDRIPVDPRLEDGLDKPLATVEVKLNNKETHKLILGKPNFNDTSLYALADPPEQVKEPLQIVLVSKEFEYAVNRPLSEWKQ